MIRFVSFPKIGQFRQAVSGISRLVTFTGLDDNGDAIYDPSIEKPVITFNGTVKMHGTNSSFCGNNGDVWAQSHNNVLTLLKDNAGFCRYTTEKKDIFTKLINRVIEKFDVDTSEDGLTVAIFGEWMGGSIQKNMGISKLPKTFVIFGIKISKPQEENYKSQWVDSSWLNDNENGIYNIEDFKTYSIDVDFNMPQLAQNKLVELTLEVEAECPVAKQLLGDDVEEGTELLGEGIVWTATYKGEKFRFKTKGKRHSISKTKSVVPVDTEKLNSIVEFVDYSVTENRFNQAIENVFNGEEIDIKKLGDVIRWMVSDITVEEFDVMVNNELTPKDVNKYISDRARKMFFELYNKH